MKFSPREKFGLGIATYVGVGFLLGSAMLYTQSYLLVAMFFGWSILASYGLWSIRCPQCDVPLVYQGKLGQFSFYAGFAHTKCQHCGWDLTKP